MEGASVSQEQTCQHCGQGNAPLSRFCNGCGKALLPAVVHDGLLPDGTVLRGTYVIDGVLGEGGMGVVYHGRHRTLGTTFAVKVLDAKLARVASLRERFLEEARIQATLQHPNIVHVLDVLDTDGVLAMVMEYIAGRTLDVFIHEEQERVPLLLAREIALKLLEAIGHAHDEGIVHRDLKPANVMLVSGVEPVWAGLKVMDFGIAKVLDANEGRTVTGAKMGTPRYMAPEQVMDARQVDRRADIYAIGLILYEMLAGRTPFEELRDFELLQAQAESSPPPLTRWRKDVPAAFEAVVMRALAKSREERFPSALAFAEALGALPLTRERVGVVESSAGRRSSGGSAGAAASKRSPGDVSGRAKALVKEKPSTLEKGAVRKPSRLKEAGDDGDWVLGETSVALGESEKGEVVAEGRSLWRWVMALLVVMVVVGVGYRLWVQPGKRDRVSVEPLTDEQVRGGGETSGEVGGAALRVGGERLEVLATPTGRMSLLPAGPHWLGSAGSLREVDLGPLWVDQAEVSVFQYGRCVAEGACPPLADVDSSDPSLPVTGVGYGSAEAFCAWAGKRLPSAEEWEAAARAGTQRDEAVGGGCAQVNFGSGRGGECAGQSSGGVESVYARELSKNGLHLWHMSGNVWEWTQSAGATQQHRLVKGGSWRSGRAEIAIGFQREVVANKGSDEIGFRCVKDKP